MVNVQSEIVQRAGDAIQQAHLVGRADFDHVEELRSGVVDNNLNRVGLTGLQAARTQQVMHRYLPLQRSAEVRADIRPVWRVKLNHEHVQHQAV